MTLGAKVQRIYQHMSILSLLFQLIGKSVPDALKDWDDMVGAWCFDNASQFPEACITEIHLGPAAYVFDHVFERVILAYGISVPQLMARNKVRMRGFPNVNESVRNALGEKAFTVDKGHYLGHASGGELDINLFPHRRSLNRGWSEDGRRFRAMERFVAGNPGALFFHRPVYDDETWIPATLEYGVFRPDETWWVEYFQNKGVVA